MLTCLPSRRLEYYVEALRLAHHRFKQVKSRNPPARPFIGPPNSPVLGKALPASASLFCDWLPRAPYATGMSLVSSLKPEGDWPGALSMPGVLLMLCEHVHAGEGGDIPYFRVLESEG